MSNTNITELLIFMLKTIEGDPFNLLVESCRPVMLNAINKRFIRGYDREDFFQEAKEVLVETVKKYKFDTDLRFLQYYSMCLETHLDNLVRKESALKRRSIKEASSLDEFYEKTGIDYSTGNGYDMNPENKAIANETFGEYLLDLSTFEKEVFYHYLTDLSYEEIAEQLNSTKTKVQNAFYRCGMKFRRLVDEDQEA